MPYATNKGADQPARIFAQPDQHLCCSRDEAHVIKQ